MGVRKEWKSRRKRSRLLSAFLLPEALLFFVVGWSLVCIGSMKGKRSSKMLKLFPAPPLFGHAVGGSSGVRHKGSKEPRSQTSWFCFMKVS